jgi:hypothetical protein
MSEDFQTQVLGHLAALGQRFDAVDRRLDAMDRRFDAMDRRFDAIDHRLDGIVARLDEQDVAIDRLTAKVDRLQQNVTMALHTAEQSVTGLTALSRRVSRLENRDPGPDAA